MAIFGWCRCRLLLTFMYAASDLSVTTVLYGRGSHLKQKFLFDVYHYHFGIALFDLWVLSLLRTSILIGATLAALRNPLPALARINSLKVPILILAIVMWILTITKMLVWTECAPTLRDPWFWSLFAWSIMAILLYMVSWMMLTKLKPDSAVIASLNVNSVNADETRPLLGNSAPVEDDGDDDSDEEKEEKIETHVKAATLGRMLRYSAPDWPYLIAAAFFMIISSLGQIFLPLLTGEVINAIAIEKDEKKFVRAIIIMGALDLGSSVAAGLRGGFFKIAMARYHIRICNQLFTSLVNQDMGFFDKIQTGEMTSRLTSDTTVMSETLSLNANIFLRSVIQMIGICVFMVKLSWRLSLVTVMGLPIIMAVSSIYGEYYKKLHEKVQKSLADANTVAEETCSTMRTVRSFANEIVERFRFRDKLDVTYKLKKKEAYAYAGYMSCTNAFQLALVVATLYYGGHLVMNGMVTGGNLVSFLLYQIDLGFALESIGYVYTGLMQAVGASKKVLEYIDRKPIIKREQPGKLKPASFRGSIEFKNVTFMYPSREDTTVLKNMSFSVKPGEVVALVGPSGGGKSTCVSLIERFYEPSSGDILLDGVPIHDYDHEYLHTQISLVGQEPVLYARSIKENIAYGMDEVEMAKVEEAARAANAHDFIVEMKKKYNTQAGEKGTHLSGGQKQRIAIARALMRDPSILLLDEATSALDSESEHVVQKAIYSKHRRRTVIVIAHRLSTVERADRIIVIDKGEIIQQGTHRELLKRQGLYSQLVHRQLGLGFEHKRELDSPDELDIVPSSFKSIASFSDNSNLSVKLSPLGRSPHSPYGSFS